MAKVKMVARDGTKAAKARVVEKTGTKEETAAKDRQQTQTERETIRFGLPILGHNMAKASDSVLAEAWSAKIMERTFRAARTMVILL